MYFSDSKDGDGHGECLRYPPVLHIVNEKLVSVVPLTLEDSSCGEYTANVWKDIDETNVQ
jgi:hypothetical protein